MTVVGSLMILVMVILRILLMNRIPKQALVMMWGIILLRLLVPFSMPELWGKYVVEVPVVELITIGEERLDGGNASTSQNSQPELMSNVMESRMNRATLLTFIWISGIILSGGVVISSHLKFRKEMRAALPVDYSFKKTIQIKESDKVDSPLTYGFFKPVIMMPSTMDWENEEQLAFVLTHEYVHIKRRDYLTKILMTIALCIHWFNPFVWLMYAMLNLDLELSCDEGVLKILGRDKRSSYLMTLLEMEENRMQTPGLAFSKNAMEERVKIMIKMKKKTSLVAAIVSLLIVGGSMTVFATVSRPSVMEGLVQPTGGTFTILDETNFTSFIEKNSEAVEELWGETDEDLELIQNGGVVIVQSGSRLQSFEAIEFATAESFSDFIDERLNSLRRSVTSRELSAIRETMEETLVRIEAGESVMIGSDREWFTEFGSYVSWDEFQLERQVQIQDQVEEVRLNHIDFEAWARQDLERRELSGEYTAAEIEILQQRYFDLLEEYKEDLEIHFILREDELWGVGSVETATVSIEIEVAE